MSKQISLFIYLIISVKTKPSFCLVRNLYLAIGSWLNFTRAFRAYLGQCGLVGGRSRGDWRSDFLCLSSGLLLTLLVSSMLFSLPHTSTPLFVKINLLTQQFPMSKTSLVRNSGVCAHNFQEQIIIIIISFPLTNNLGILCSVPKSLQKPISLVSAQLWSLKANGFYMRQCRSCLCNLG